MTTRVPVMVYAEDPVLRSGLVHLLRPRPEVDVLTQEEESRAEVALVVVDEMDDNATRLLRRLQRSTTTRTGVVVKRIDREALQTAVDCEVAAVIRRSEATQDRLVTAVLALANGEAVLPGDLLATLLDHVSKIQRHALDPNGLTLATLTTRETDMLRLLADGLGTAEIATRLAYSERTVKNILHGVTSRLNLRNRTHAVGYVMRNGLI